MNGFICPVCGTTPVCGTNPVCGEWLEKRNGSFVCKKGHCFDIAAKGYVNLLLSNQMNAKLPGDNKLMVNARAEFLGKGYYSHLAEEIKRTAQQYFTGGTVLDAGCGEGYYTQKVYEMLKENYDSFTLLGMDISKFACAHAARRFKGDDRCTVAAASIFHIPMANSSADMIITMFAPFCREEFLRVLENDGVLIMAIPAEEHLMSLKAAVYDEPYKNEVAEYDIEGFEFIESRKISRSIFIDNGKDIKSLFAMTPYYYKTSREGHERVERLTELETDAAFEVLVYRKK